jgi:4,5-DOPA dioxygenase extradiol
MTQTSTPPGQVMPAAFFGHGNPMNALEVNRYTAAWRAFGQSVPRPRAILVISAHWYINATAVTAMPRPRTIHDFFGFPEALFDIQYPAPGLPELADEVSDVVHPTWVGADVDSWGIDHGTWSVLVHAFPDASIPVVQLSINASKSFEHHLELGRKLAPLRDRGVLIVASGNVVHNLRGMDWSRTDHGYGWAQRFDQDAKERMLTEPTEFTTLDAHPDFRTAVPTPTTSFRRCTWPVSPAPPRATPRRCSSRLRLRVAVDDRLHPWPVMPLHRRRGRSPVAPGRYSAGRIQHLSLPSRPMTSGPHLKPTPMIDLTEALDRRSRNLVDLVEVVEVDEPVERGQLLFCGRWSLPCSRCWAAGESCSRALANCFLWEDPGIAAEVAGTLADQ